MTKTGKVLIDQTLGDLSPDERDTLINLLIAVKRQQLVFGALNDVIASGEIHAVHMKTYTPAERPSQA